MSEHEELSPRTGVSLRNGLPYGWWKNPEFIALVLGVVSISVLGVILYYAAFYL